MFVVSHTTALQLEWLSKDFDIVKTRNSRQYTSPRTRKYLQGHDASQHGTKKPKRCTYDTSLNHGILVGLYVSG